MVKLSTRRMINGARDRRKHLAGDPVLRLAHASAQKLGHIHAQALTTYGRKSSGNVKLRKVLADQVRSVRNRLKSVKVSSEREKMAVSKALRSWNRGKLLPVL